MKQVLSNIKQGVIDLWNDEEGAQMVEKILIIAAISIPLLGLLLFFSSEIRDWVSSNFEEVKDSSDTNNAVDDNPF